MNEGVDHDTMTRQGKAVLFDDIVSESVRLLHDVVLEVIYIANTVGVAPVAVMEVAGRRALGMR